MSSSAPPTPLIPEDSSQLTNGNGNGTAAAPLPSVDSDVFRSYLLALLPPVLGASVEDIEGTLFDEEFDEKVLRYASDGNSVIYVAKTRIDSEGVPCDLLMWAYRAATDYRTVLPFKTMGQSPTPTHSRHFSNIPKILQ